MEKKYRIRVELINDVKWYIPEENYYNRPLGKSISGEEFWRNIYPELRAYVSFTNIKDCETALDKYIDSLRDKTIEIIEYPYNNKSWYNI